MNVIDTRYQSIPADAGAGLSTLASSMIPEPEQVVAVDPVVRRPLSDALISVVLPVFNEAAVIEALAGQLIAVLSPLGCRYETLFVNDARPTAARSGSMRWPRLPMRPRIALRGTSHQAALHAGLSHARGDAVIVMTAICRTTRPP